MVLAAAALPFVCLSGLPANAQSIMRTPSLHVEPRAPSINSNIAPRVNSNIGATAVARTPSPRVSVTPAMHAVPRIGVQSTLPNARYSPNLSPACDYAYRGSDGECLDRPVVSGDGGGKQGGSAKKGNGGARDNAAQAAVNLQAVPNELVAEIDGALTDRQVEELARRHGLTRLEARNFPLLGATIGLFRITDRRPADVVRREVAGDGSVRSVQFNLRYVLQDQKVTPTEGDPAQYALAQLRLPQAHALARGMNVTIAVIDSGIDANHPELANAIADSFDALGSKEGPHVHGTGIAGAIAAHARLMGSAPEVRILAIRAFGASASGAQSTSYVILKGLDYAALHGAQIVNMSFAGPKDSLIERAVAATAARGIVLIAAAGNAGAKIAAALSGRQSERYRGQRHRRPGKTVLRFEPRQPYRARRARRRYLPARTRRQIPDDVGHLLFGRPCQRHRRAAVGTQSCVEAERRAYDFDGYRPRPRRAGPRRSVRGRASRCIRRRHRRGRLAGHAGCVGEGCAGSGKISGAQ